MSEVISDILIPSEIIVPENLGASPSLKISGGSLFVSGNNLFYTIGGLVHQVSGANVS